MIAVPLAMILDAIFGEPKWLWDRAPHPAVLMGRAVAWMDRTFNTGGYVGGVITVAVLVWAMICLGLLLMMVPGVWVEVILGAMLLAQKSLVQHVQRVADADAPRGFLAARDRIRPRCQRAAV